MQPEINWLKVNHFGDLDTIAEKQADIYKKYNYNALASVIPLLIQVVILLGLVEVIYNPLRYIFCLPEDLSAAMVALTGELTGADITSSSIQMTVVNAVTYCLQMPLLLCMEQKAAWNKTSHLYDLTSVESGW